MNELKHYCIHSVVWDICPRPLYKGKLTKNYIHKCFELDLPLDYAHFYVKAVDNNAAARYYEKLVGKKLRRWCIREMLGLTREDELCYDFCIDAGDLKDDNRYYDYMKSYVLGSLEGQKKAGIIDENETEKGHLMNTGIGVFLEFAGHGYCEDYGCDVDNDKEWEKQTRRYIEETIGRKLSERELGAYYGL